MQVKKYQAADTQQAMRLVRAAHGPDAVILDCRSIAGGVEVVVSLEELIESSAPATHLPKPIWHLRVIPEVSASQRP